MDRGKIDGPSYGGPPKDSPSVHGPCQDRPSTGDWVRYTWIRHGNVLTSQRWRVRDKSRRTRNILRSGTQTADDRVKKHVLVVTWKESSKNKKTHLPRWNHSRCAATFKLQGRNLESACNRTRNSLPASIINFQCILCEWDRHPSVLTNIVYRYSHLNLKKTSLDDFCYGGRLSGGTLLTYYAPFSDVIEVNRHGYARMQLRKV